MSQQRILITGMSGLIGGALRQQLEGRYALSALNRGPIAGVPCHQADIGDLEAIQPAFEGVDTVVHLAAIAKSDASWEDVLHHNISGTYNVFEAARRAGVKRVVYASSGATVSNMERDMPYQALTQGRYDELPARGWDTLTHHSPVRPAGLYGCSKVWGEALARHFVDISELSIICLRIGHVTAENVPRQPRQFSVWCSQRDIVRLLEACITAPESLRYDVFFGVSDNKWSYRDMAHVKNVLGFEPEDRAEDHR